jgi:hypothetical protein
MVRGYFVTWSTYGLRLPHGVRLRVAYVGLPALLPYGFATKVQPRRSVAGRSHDPVLVAC